MIGTPYISADQGVEGRNIRLIQSSSQLTVAVDTVIFENGEVDGPNRSQYDAEITGRKIAADALTEGQQPDHLLEELAGSGISDLEK